MRQEPLEDSSPDVSRGVPGQNIALVLLALTCSVSTTFGQQGRKAPPFVLDDLSGNRVELQDLLSAGPVLISFWATWCKPCLEELREVQKIADDFGPLGVTVVGISTDSEKSVAKVKPYVRSKGYSFRILLDTNGDVARSYYARVIPFTAIIDTAGSIAYTRVGYKKGDELDVRKLLKDLLKK